jgi:hypothetical protein
MTADGDVLSIPIPRETGVIRHFQEQMPHGLFVPDVAVSALPWPFTKIKKLANNKPFECRWTVFLSPSFRQMLEGLLVGVGPPSVRPRGNRG